MKKLVALSLLAGAAMLVPAAASAQTSPAVASFEQRASLAPRDGGAQIELAQAYLRDGRASDADQAYRRALALDNAMMETRSGDAIFSHQVARKALARTSVASR
jgi:Flp pilus assembly protein TadD